MYGGRNSANENEYLIGERVMIRGEMPNENDVWTVSNKTPDFITLENKNINTISDPIRVVEPNQITHYQPISYMQQQYEGQMYQSQEQPNSFYTRGYNGQPNINVAPIIKIINGDDKSTSPMVDNEDIISPSSQYEPQEHPIKIKKSANNENMETSAANKSIDFSEPLMIVKKG